MYARLPSLLLPQHDVTTTVYKPEQGGVLDLLPRRYGYAFQEPPLLPRVQEHEWQRTGGSGGTTTTGTSWDCLVAQQPWWPQSRAVAPGADAVTGAVQLFRPTPSHAVAALTQRAHVRHRGQAQDTSSTALSLPTVQPQRWRSDDDDTDTVLDTSTWRWLLYEEQYERSLIIAAAQRTSPLQGYDDNTDDAVDSTRLRCAATAATSTTSLCSDAHGVRLPPCRHAVLRTWPMYSTTRRALPSLLLSSSQQRQEQERDVAAIRTSPWQPSALVLNADATHARVCATLQRSCAAHRNDDDDSNDDSAHVRDTSHTGAVVAAAATVSPSRRQHSDEHSKQCADACRARRALWRAACRAKEDVWRRARGLHEVLQQQLQLMAAEQAQRVALVAQFASCAYPQPCRCLLLDSEVLAMSAVTLEPALPLPCLFVAIVLSQYEAHATRMLDAQQVQLCAWRDMLQLCVACTRARDDVTADEARVRGTLCDYRTYVTALHAQQQQQHDDVTSRLRCTYSCTYAAYGARRRLADVCEAVRQRCLVDAEAVARRALYETHVSAAASVMLCAQQRRCARALHIAAADAARAALQRDEAMAWQQLLLQQQQDAKEVRAAAHARDAAAATTAVVATYASTTSTRVSVHDDSSAAVATRTEQQQRQPLRCRAVCSVTDTRNSSNVDDEEGAAATSRARAAAFFLESALQMLVCDEVRMRDALAREEAFVARHALLLSPFHARLLHGFVASYEAVRRDEACARVLLTRVVACEAAARNALQQRCVDERARLYGHSSSSSNCRCCYRGGGAATTMLLLSSPVHKRRDNDATAAAAASTALAASVHDLSQLQRCVMANLAINATVTTSSPPTPPPHYAVLGVTPTVTAAELARRYRRLSLELHPDRAAYRDRHHTHNDGDDARRAREAAVQARFQRITAAYEVLSDPARRADYDTRHHVNFAARAQAVCCGIAAHNSRTTQQAMTHDTRVNDNDNDNDDDDDDDGGHASPTKRARVSEDDEDSSSDEDDDYAPHATAATTDGGASSSSSSCVTRTASRFALTPACATQTHAHSTTAAQPQWREVVLRRCRRVTDAASSSSWGLTLRDDVLVSCLMHAGVPFPARITHVNGRPVVAGQCVAELLLLQQQQQQQQQLRASDAQMTTTSSSSAAAAVASELRLTLHFAVRAYTLVGDVTLLAANNNNESNSHDELDALVPPSWRAAALANVAAVPRIHNAMSSSSSPQQLQQECSPCCCVVAVGDTAVDSAEELRAALQQCAAAASAATPCAPLHSRSGSVLLHCVTLDGLSEHAAM